MTEVLGRWRATYTPGEWIVLAGPTSLVILQPATGELSGLVTSLWESVLAASSILDIAARLTAFQMDQMPSLGAFFWTAEGMRSLVRGVVTVTDDGTGATVAEGAGVHTWNEVGHGDLDRVRIVMQPTAGHQLELPLVVGVVCASSVVLDASPSSRVSSAQGLTFSTTADAETVDSKPGPEAALLAPGPIASAPEAATTRPETVVGIPSDSEVQEVEWGQWGQQIDVVPNHEQVAQEDADDVNVGNENADTELLVLPSSPTGDPGTTTEPMATGVASEEPRVLASFCAAGHSNAPSAETCRLCDSPIQPGMPRWASVPVLASLTSPGVEPVDLDRTVLIGRAPSADRSAAESPRLMTVQSPSHDISRTHVQVTPENWQILVTDLQSTNGTVLTGPGLTDPGSRPSSQRLSPGQPVSVPVGSRIELGDGVSVAVDRPQ